MSQQIAQWTFVLLQNVSCYRSVLFICHRHQRFCIKIHLLAVDQLFHLLQGIFFFFTSGFSFFNFQFPFILLFAQLTVNIKTVFWKPTNPSQIDPQLAKCSAACLFQFHCVHSSAPRNKLKRNLIPKKKALREHRPQPRLSICRLVQKNVGIGPIS